jgi:hypothetical protein
MSHSQYRSIIKLMKRTNLTTAQNNATAYTHVKQKHMKRPSMRKYLKKLFN